MACWGSCIIAVGDFDFMVTVQQEEEDASSSVSMVSMVVTVL